MSVQHITKENFDALVKGSDKPVLLDFWAVWCGPCKMIAPIVEEIAQEHPEILVGKVDVDQEMDLAMAYGVSSIPTLLVFKDGAVVATSVGYKSKGDLLKLLNL